MQCMPVVEPCLGGWLSFEIFADCRSKAKIIEKSLLQMLAKFATNVQIAWVY